MGVKRSVFVISDLHLGGAPPDSNASGDDELSEAARRGFRMMTEPQRLARFIDDLREVDASELVINGDFIDFLAERTERDAAFRAFIYDEDLAVTVFRRVAGWIDQGHRACEHGREDWDPLVFDALRRFLASGKRVTILLGNHDLELCLPRVREELFRRLGGGELHIRYDGEALPLGRDILIEHGNLYDRANMIDQDSLRKLRAEITRGVGARSAAVFTPPVGSRIVAEVMNPIKSRYGFIDLLKPESEPLFALLLALEPEVRNDLGVLLSALGGLPLGPIATMRGPASTCGAPQPTMRGGAAGTSVMRDGSDHVPEVRDPVAAALAQLWSPAEATNFLKDIATGQNDDETLRSVGSWLTSNLALTQLLVGAKWMGPMARVRAVRRAMRALESDRCFDVNAEAKTYAARAAEVGREGGFKCVVFGHTHHAKDVTSNGFRYLNSGTWANLMAFPVLPDDDVRAQQELERFIANVRANELRSYILFAPTYVRLDLEDDRLDEAGVYIYDPCVPLRENRRFSGFAVGAGGDR